MTILSLLEKYILQGHERSIAAKKNILASLFIKGISIVISLLFVPLALDYVNTSQYGIWLTMTSIVGWFTFFDIGLTQGLRNKFAEAITLGDDDLAQSYVSTTYFLLSLIFFGFWIIFIVANFFLDWTRILSLSNSLQTETKILAVIIFTYFCIDFVLRIITTLLIARQESAKSALIDTLGQLASLVVVFIMVKLTTGSLIKLSLALCLSPLVVLFLSNFFYYRGAFHKYRPVLSKVKISYTKDLIHLGLVFLIIQIAAIIQYQTANIIIARNFGTPEVTAYNIVFKYFSVLIMLNTIFITPFWSASTEAFIKNDLTWIKNAIKKYNYFNMGLLLVGVVMLMLSPHVYDLWLGKGKVSIPFPLSVWGFFHFSVMMFGTKYVYFLNGINALRIQSISSIISPFVFILVALLLIRTFHIGTSALFIASIVSNLNALVIAPVQFHQIINRHKSGIWIR